MSVCFYIASCIPTLAGKTHLPLKDEGSCFEFSYALAILQLHPQVSLSLSIPSSLLWSFHFLTLMKISKSLSSVAREFSSRNDIDKVIYPILKFLCQGLSCILLILDPSHVQDYESLLLCYWDLFEANLSSFLDCV